MSEKKGKLPGSGMTPEIILKRGSTLYAKRISARMKGYRLREGYTQTDLANKLNVSKTTLSGYETGRIIPPLDIIIELANYMDMTLDQYLLLDETKRVASLEEEALVRVFRKASPIGRRYIFEAARGIVRVDTEDPDILKNLEKEFD